MESNNRENNLWLLKNIESKTCYQPASFKGFKEGPAGKLSKKKNSSSKLSDSFLNTIIDSVDALIMVLDKKGKILFQNKICENKTGFDLVQIKNKYFCDVFFLEETDKENLSTFFETPVLADFPKTFQNYFQARNGETYIVSWRNKVVLNSQGGIRYIIATGSDVTEKVKIQKILEIQKNEIAKKEKLLHEITSSIPGVVYRIKKDVDGKISCTFISSGIKDISGLSPSEIYQEPEKLFLAIHPEDRDGFFKSILDAQENTDTLSAEVRAFHHLYKDYCWLKVRSVPKHGTNGEVIWDGTITEIMKEKEAERNLQEKNQDLAKINQELDRFVYSTSHDLRAPLTSLLGIINLIKEEFKNQDLLSYLLLAEKSVHKLDKILRSIHEYSRNNKSEVEIQEINFKSLLKKIINKYTCQSQDQIETIFEIDQKVSFYSDFHRVSTVLEHVISNSFKYFDEHKASWIKTSINCKVDQVSIIVEDNGMGIQQDQVQKIFDMFVRATAKSDGAGLGLYIAKETLKKLNGSIEVVSKENIGSTFTIIIPNLAA